MGFDIDESLDQAYKGELLNELVIKLICLKLKEIFINEPNIKNVKAPVTVVGDVHGYKYFLSCCFNWFFNKKNNVFMNIVNFWM